MTGLQPEAIWLIDTTVATAAAAAAAAAAAGFRLEMFEPPDIRDIDEAEDAADTTEDRFRCFSLTVAGFVGTLAVAVVVVVVGPPIVLFLDNDVTGLFLFCILSGDNAAILDCISDIRIGAPISFPRVGLVVVGFSMEMVFEGDDEDEDDDVAVDDEEEDEEEEADVGDETADDFLVVVVGVTAVLVTLTDMLGLPEPSAGFTFSVNGPSRSLCVAAAAAAVVVRDDEPVELKDAGNGVMTLMILGGFEPPSSKIPSTDSTRFRLRSFLLSNDFILRPMISLADRRISRGCLLGLDTALPVTLPGAETMPPPSFRIAESTDLAIFMLVLNIVIPPHVTVELWTGADELGGTAEPIPSGIISTDGLRSTTTSGA